MRKIGILVRTDEVLLKSATNPISVWQAVNPTLIDADKIYHTLKGLNKSVSPTVAVSGGTPTAVDVTPDNQGLIPLKVSATLGSLATGETITVTVTATYDDGTTDSVTATLSASGTVDASGLIGDGKVITKLSITAQSNKTSTSATCTVTVIGLQY